MPEQSSSTTISGSPRGSTEAELRARGEERRGFAAADRRGGAAEDRCGSAGEAAALRRAGISEEALVLVLVLPGLAERMAPRAAIKLAAFDFCGTR